MKEKINKPRIIREQQGTYERVVKSKKRYNRKKKKSKSQDCF